MKSSETPSLPDDQVSGVSLGDLDEFVNAPTTHENNGKKELSDDDERPNYSKSTTALKSNAYDSQEDPSQQDISDEDHPPYKNTTKPGMPGPGPSSKPSYDAESEELRAELEDAKTRISDLERDKQRLERKVEKLQKDLDVAQKVLVYLPIFTF
jgi:hypothetical protein